MLRAMTIAVVALAPTLVSAANWIKISDSIFVDVDSVRADDSFAMIVASLKVDNNINLHRILVDKEDCDRGYGLLHIFHLANSSKLNEQVWAKGSGSAASYIGEYLCSRLESPGKF